jgi:hypothetical protein
MLLLAEEAEHMMSEAGQLARMEAEEETEKFLRQYEQRAKQIILKIREEARGRAAEIAERFREALMLRIEENSTAAIGQVISGIGGKTEEILQRLKETAKREVRQALAEGLMASQPSAGVNTESKLITKADEPAASPHESTPEIKEETVSSAGEDFESWLRQ